jgi:hypothetical protein
VSGGRVQALPQQREGLGSVKQPCFDPGAAQRGVDLFGESQALDRGVAVGGPERFAARVAVMSRNWRCGSSETGG